MKTIRPTLQNLDTGSIETNCSLAYIAREIGRAKITLQRWCNDYRDGKIRKKLVDGTWWIHFDAIEYKQNKGS